MTEWIELRDKQDNLFLAPESSLWKVISMTEDGEGHAIITFQNEDRTMTFLAEETDAPSPT